MSKFRPDLIQLVLEKLHPHYVRVGVASQRYEGQTSSTEPWYNSQYNVKKIDSSVIDLWSCASSIEDLHLPAVNEFIPTNFDLVSLSEDYAETPAVPKLIMVTLIAPDECCFVLR